LSAWRPNAAQFWFSARAGFVGETRSASAMARAVLDVPFGTGRFAELYRKRVFRVAGIDSFPDMLKVARNEPGAYIRRMGRQGREGCHASLYRRPIRPHRLRAVLAVHHSIQGRFAVPEGIPPGMSKLLHRQAQQPASGPAADRPPEPQKRMGTHFASHPRYTGFQSLRSESNRLEVLPTMPLMSISNNTRQIPRRLPSDQRPRLGRISD